MVAAESGNNFVRPSVGFPEITNPMPFTAKGSTSVVTGNGPIDWPRISAKEKVQASLKQFELFKPKREDSKRFLQSGPSRRSDPKVCEILKGKLNSNFVFVIC